MIYSFVFSLPLNINDSVEMQFVHYKLDSKSQMIFEYTIFSLSKA